MLEYMILPFKRYADFKGRSLRIEYWGFALLNFIVFAVILGISMVLGLSFDAFQQLEQGGDPSALFGAGFFVLVGLAGIYSLAVFIPSIAVAVRRFHDRDMSGWWYLGLIVLGVIPFVGWIATIASFVITCLPGTPGPNRFGMDPRDPTGAEVFA
ncbi:DUF805 domain-containing protein [Novosphingobium sp. ZW T3_23]|uniref:DUF805 domain-containing protein n=1 Tax=Novosphingobium sp. ZW T3_23 TaxID=3378084 RepID=UPI0038524CC3